MKEFIFSITQEDVKKAGGYENPMTCPFATAFNRQFPGYENIRARVDRIVSRSDNFMSVKTVAMIENEFGWNQYAKLIKPHPLAFLGFKRKFTTTIKFY